jgi:hypothetical protein
MKTILIYLVVGFSFFASEKTNAQTISLPDFFGEVIRIRQNHSETKIRLESCGIDLRQLTPIQIRNLKKLAVIHSLLSSQTAKTGSINPVWGIPYFWHYTNPNPRHFIVLIATGQKLTDVKPPSGFEKYPNLAQVDRSPELFWSDFASEKPMYRYKGLADFYTFGWCSEREMAFKSIASILGFNCTIVISGNHVWSVVEIEKGSGQWIRADHTFNVFYRCDEPQVPTSTLGKWYNTKASSKKVLAKVRAVQISKNRLTGL